MYTLASVHSRKLHFWLCNYDESSLRLSSVPAPLVSGFLDHSLARCRADCIVYCRELFCRAHKLDPVVATETNLMLNPRGRSVQSSPATTIFRRRLRSLGVDFRSQLPWSLQIPPRLTVQSLSDAQHVPYCLIQGMHFFAVLMHDEIHLTHARVILKHTILVDGPNAGHSGGNRGAHSAERIPQCADDPKYLRSEVAST